MKLIVQIPCFNEESSLAQTITDIPREIKGIDEVEVLVIDDGSTDRTVETAYQCGADHVIRHRRNRGLACAFRTGIDAALRLGADIIVNTDGDNQYSGSEIPKLIAPLLSERADIVIGDRQPWNVLHFSRRKKILQAAGSLFVRMLSGTDVPDAVSGFRAFTRDAAIRLNVISAFSYTIETIIQAGKNRAAIASVAISTNSTTRESRLFRSIPEFVGRSVVTLIRSYAMYRPLHVFFWLSMIPSLLGVGAIARFLYFYALGTATGHIQSVVLGGVCLLIGFIALMIGLVADLISFNRQLIEMVLERVRRIELRENAVVSANAMGNDLHTVGECGERHHLA